MNESSTPTAAVLPNAPRITYTDHKNGIHELTFKDTSRQAVDDWAIYQLWLDTVMPTDETIFELIDAQVGFPSMSYTIDRARHTIGQHSKSRKYYTAVLYPANQRFYVNLFVGLINGLRTRNVQLRLFSSLQRAEAEKWLLTSRATLIGTTSPSAV